MAFGGGQVDEAAFAQQVDLASVFERVLVDEVARGAFRRRHTLERGDIDLDVEVARVRNNRAIFHQGEMFFRQHALVAGDGAEDVAELGGFGHRHDAETVHDGLERFRGINFGDDDFSSGATGARGEAAAAPSVAGYDELRSGEQEIRGADDAVDGRLSGAVTVVEQVLGIGVVDGDDGKLQHAFLSHGAQADDAGRGLFRAADHAFESVGALGVEKANQVGAVVHGDLRLVIDGGQDVVVVGVVVLNLDC